MLTNLRVLDSNKAIDGCEMLDGLEKPASWEDLTDGLGMFDSFNILDNDDVFGVACLENLNILV